MRVGEIVVLKTEISPAKKKISENLKGICSNKGAKQLRQPECLEGTKGVNSSLRVCRVL